MRPPNDCLAYTDDLCGLRRRLIVGLIEETNEDWQRKFQNVLFRHEKPLDMIDWGNQSQREKMLEYFFIEGVSQAADAAKDMILEAFKKDKDE